MFAVRSVSTLMVLAAGLWFAAGAGIPAAAADPTAVAPARILQAATHVDLQRYMGRWYLIANIPNREEFRKVGVFVDYTLQPDGRIVQIFGSRNLDFTAPLSLKRSQARIVDRRNNARWKLAETWAMGRESVILYVDDDYRYALVGHPSRNTVWVLAREARMTDEVYAELLGRLEEQGYDLGRMLKMPQIEDQFGAPGYQ